jgi:glycosyltransferase involved in cell wall biosynthesis
MAGKSLLIVSQFAPPSPMVAARRIGGLAKYLGRMGFRVTVLTSDVFGHGRIEGASRVVRTGDLLTSRLNWRRRSLQALGGSLPAFYRDRSVVANVIVPDVGLVTWLPFALPRALRLVREEHFDCVLTSSPPESTHLIGLVLRRRGLPWIAELRDGWTFDPPRPPFPTVVQRRLDRALERAVLRRADAIVGVTAPISADAGRRFGVRAEVITNAFDPEEGADPRAADDLLDGSRHTVVHTGRMAVSGRTPHQLLEALRLLAVSTPEVAAQLEIVLAGPLADDERDLLARAEREGLIRWVGALDRPRALALQRRADTLLVLAQGASGPSVATGKLFEYLGAGRPVLVLGEGTAAAEIVRSANAGIVVSATDPEAIASALVRLVGDEPLPPPDAAAVTAYAFPAVAARLARLVDEVVSAHERSQGVAS